jgi:hypothetical protein
LVTAKEELGHFRVFKKNDIPDCKRGNTVVTKLTAVRNITKEC